MWTISQLWGFALLAVLVFLLFLNTSLLWGLEQQVKVAIPHPYLHKAIHISKILSFLLFWNGNYCALFFPLDLLIITQLFDHNRTSCALAWLHEHSKGGRNKELPPVARGSGRLMEWMTGGTQAPNLIAFLGGHGSWPEFSQRHDAAAHVTVSTSLCMPRIHSIHTMKTLSNTSHALGGMIYLYIVISL